MAKLRIIIPLFGVISSMSALISGNTLNFWLAKEKISTISIGFFSIVALPYACNFLWAPIIDSYKIPFLCDKFGHRRSWLLVLQIFFTIFTLCLSRTDPVNNLPAMALSAFFVSLISSTQDINLNAMRAELIERKNLGSFSAIYILGYRIGGLVASSGAIYLSAIIDFKEIYLLFALVTSFISILLLFLTANYKNSQDSLVDSNFDLKKIINKVIKPIGSLEFIIYILIFLILYRVADNFINTMINPFLLFLSFNEWEIATVSKALGIICSLFGSLLAGKMMNEDIYISLYRFGLIHLLAHSLFLTLLVFDSNIYLLSFVIGFESITGGMTMTAYIALITSLCSGKYRGTQYSFLSSMMGLSRAFLPTISGIIVHYYGWHSFFIFVTFSALPSLIILNIIIKKFRC